MSGIEPIFQSHYIRTIRVGKAGIGEPMSKKALKAIHELGKATGNRALPGKRVVSPTFKIKSIKPMPFGGLFVSEVRYIKREEVKVNIERLNKKHKGKYRFKANAYAPIYWEDTPDPPGTTSFSGSTWGRTEPNQKMTGSTVYSKTRYGAEASAILQLLHQCRRPLTKKQKLENRSNKTETKHKRHVSVEVRVSNALDFIMNDDGKQVWHKIRKES